MERADQQGKAEALIDEGTAGLRRLVQTAEAQRVLLVIDQFEEVFTLCQDVAERKQFLATVLEALNTTANQLSVIVAMRADFVGRCFEQAYSGLAGRVQNHLVAVKPMGREELRDAIVKPAEQVGLTLEPELVMTLLNDVEKAPGSLPLLQYTLTELWQQRQDDILQLGGVTGTLKQRADEVYQHLTLDQQRTAKHIFLNLTQLGEGAEDMRRRVTQSSLVTAQHPPAAVDGIVKQLADANLVVTNELIRKGDGNRVAVVDVAHEALIRHWPKLRQWLEENRDLIRQQRKIELAAQEWEAQGKQAYLLQGRQLSDACAFRRQHAQHLPLSALAETLIKRSIGKRNLNRALLSSLLILPLIAVEAFLRDESVNRNYRRLYSDNPAEQRQAVLALVQGCRELRDWSKWMKPIGARFFGNCESLYGERGLSKANLLSADLHSANLRSTDLSYANLRSADLNFAQLSSANLSSADLRSASLKFTSLHSANLYFSDFSASDLSFAVLHSTDLRGADLSSANLSYANLNNASLNNADIRNTILLSTNLQTVKGIINEQLTGDYPPLLSNSSLPMGIEIDANRDCNQLPQVLLDRGYFSTLEEAEVYVEEARQKTWP